MSTSSLNRSYGYSNTYRPAKFSESPRRKQSRLPSLIAIWLLLIGGGITLLISAICFLPRQIATPVQWPQESELGLRADLSNVVMFANPCLASTQADLKELAELTQTDNVCATVVFFEPQAKDAGWRESESVKAAQKLKNTRVVLDVEGQEFRRFGIQAPQTLVYSGSGTLESQGNVNASRQHLTNSSTNASTNSSANSSANFASRNSSSGGSVSGSQNTGFSYAGVASQTAFAE